MNQDTPEPPPPPPKPDPIPSAQAAGKPPGEARPRYFIIDYNGEHEDKSLIADFADNGDLVLTAFADGTPLDDDYDSTHYDWEQRIVVKAQDLPLLAEILTRKASKPLPDGLREKIVAGLKAQIWSPFSAEAWLREAGVPFHAETIRDRPNSSTVTSPVISEPNEKKIRVRQPGESAMSLQIAEWLDEEEGDLGGESGDSLLPNAPEPPSDPRP